MNVRYFFLCHAFTCDTWQWLLSFIIQQQSIFCYITISIYLWPIYICGCSLIYVMFFKNRVKSMCSQEKKDLWSVRHDIAIHYGPEQKKHRINSHLINHCPTRKGVSEVSEQAREWVVRTNKRTDDWVNQYSNLYSWLFWPTVWFNKTQLSSIMTKTK